MLIVLILTSDDADKLESIYRKYAKPLYFCILQIIKDRHLAEDALQITFVKLTRNIDKVNDADSSQTKHFVYTIARNSAIDLYHARRKDEQASVPYDENLHAGPDDWKEEETIAKAALDDLEYALTQLQEADREIILWKYKMGYSCDQIAEILDIRSDAARQRLSRAKKKAARIIEQRRKEGREE